MLGWLVISAMPIWGIVCTLLSDSYPSYIIVLNKCIMTSFSKWFMCNLHVTTCIYILCWSTKKWHWEILFGAPFLTPGLSQPSPHLALPEVGCKCGMTYCQIISIYSSVSELLVHQNIVPKRYGQFTKRWHSRYWGFPSSHFLRSFTLRCAKSHLRNLGILVRWRLPADRPSCEGREVGDETRFPGLGFLEVPQLAPN